MEKRYQLFISSTFADLQEERKMIMEAALEMDCFPAGMEMFPASNSEQFEYIKGIIDQSDYYVIVIGGRYGSTAEDGISYTEKEFDYAVEKEIPIFAFIRNNIKEIEVKKTDENGRKKKMLDQFRKKVENNRLVTYWDTPYELKSKLFTSLTKGFKMFPRDGWIKGNISTDTELLKQINVLRDENEKLRESLRNEVKEDKEDFNRVENQVIEVETIENIFTICSSAELQITYTTNYDQRIIGESTLVNVLRVIGSRLLYYTRTESIKNYMDENLFEIVDEYEEESDDSVISSYSFDEIKIKLYSLEVIDMVIDEGLEYIGLTQLGKKVYFKTIKY